jgi:glycosyltransferase involved in cell wall biosynthesis
VRVVVLTTSYPRSGDDVAGVFVRDAVENLRRAGVEVEVVSPASFPHFGLAYGHGIVGNLRRRPWLVAAVPLFLISYARAARRAARRADLVHAHWLPSAIPALAARRPFVLQLWGTDVELARRARPVARLLILRARLVLCASEALADAARDLGARETRVVPAAVRLPEHVEAPDEPPHVLFVGRLSEEKGVPELVEATAGMPRVIVGDGPLRDAVPDAVGFVPPSELGPYYERAAIVVCPSRREGYGVVAREAMAYGRPVVAAAVGGLLEAVEDEVTGLLVPPRDPRALRLALERLLGDPALRERLGEAARARARERFSPEVAAAQTLAAYRHALGAAERSEPLVESLREQERAWNERAFVRELYGEWFELVSSAMSTVPGLSVELGAGIGRFSEIRPDVVSTDVEPTPWAERVVDAEELPFGAGELSNVVLIDVFHHLARPARFLHEAARVLAPGGRIVILDPYCSTVSARLYGHFHHERTDLEADPFADDRRVGEAALASNQARATLAFFRGGGELETRWPEFRIVERRRLALLAYPLSGGFTHRSLVPAALGRVLRRLEPALEWAAPALAFRCLVVLERS